MGHGSPGGNQWYNSQEADSQPYAVCITSRCCDTYCRHTVDVLVA